MSTTGRIAGLLAAAGILWGIWAPFFLGMLHEPPVGMHSWKQGDCFALAQGFLEDDNWDILDPRAQSLVPVDGKVNAELPVVPYLAAVVARFTGGETLGEAFRTLTLLFSSLAPLGLFLFVWARADSFTAGVLPMAFLASCPLLGYYATGFHPDAAAFGPLLAGMLLSIRAIEDAGSTVLFSLGVALMTLGSLMKMSMAPYLAVPALVALLAAHREGRGGGPWRLVAELPARVLVALGLAGSLLTGQFFYLRVRARAYDPTLFTASPHPFTSLDHLGAVVTQAWDLWLADLFSPPQLVLLGIALGVHLVWAVRGRETDGLAVAAAVSACTMVVLFLLFGKQFEWHDYYAIATFYPLASLLVVRATLEMWEVGRRSEVGTAGVVTGLCLLGLAVMMVLPLQERLAQRVTPWWRGQTRWLDGARLALDSCGEACGGPVAVLGAQAPNLALTRLGRRGLVLGRAIGTGLAMPSMSSMAEVAEYLDARGVRVLVFRRELLGSVDPGSLFRWFREAASRGDALILLRREGAEEAPPGTQGAVPVSPGAVSPPPRGSPSP